MSRAGGEDGEGAEGFGDEAAGVADLGFEDGEALRLVDDARFALDKAVADGGEVDHFHFDGGAGLVFFEDRVDGGAHALVGHGVHDTTVENAVGVQVLRRDVDVAEAARGVAFDHLYAEELAKAFIGGW